MLSVIIPAFNEEEAIGQTLDDLQATLQQAGIVAEIIKVFLVLASFLVLVGIAFGALAPVTGHGLLLASMGFASVLTSILILATGLPADLLRRIWQK